MLLKELIEQHNINPNELPQGILEINIGEEELISNIKKVEKKGKIIFEGEIGKASMELMINLSNFDKDEYNQVYSYFNNKDEKITDTFPINKIKEYLLNPMVTIKIKEKYTFNVSYNSLGREISRV